MGRFLYGVCGQAPAICNGQTLIKKVKAVYTAIDMRLPKLEKDNNIVDIDPFTIYGLFNKGITNANRIKILQGFATEFSIKAPVPENFDGIPVLNNMAATFYYFLGDRQDGDIENIWSVYSAAMEYSKTHSESAKAAFVQVPSRVGPVDKVAIQPFIMVE